MLAAALCTFLAIIPGGFAASTEAMNPDVKCDFIHVDGDHSYEGALADLRAMAEHVSPPRAALLVTPLRAA